MAQSISDQVLYLVESAYREGAEEALRYGFTDWNESDSYRTLQRLLPHIKSKGPTHG